MIWRTCLFVLGASIIAFAQSAATPAALGISFIDGSTSTLLLERNGKKYLVDLAARSAHEVASGEKNDGAAGPERKNGSDAKPDGAKVFVQNCAKCHGEDGKGKPEIGTPNFTDPKVQASITDEQITTTIKKGRKGTAMPAWAGKLSEQQITAVAAYVRSLGSGTPAGGNKRERAYSPGDDMLISLPTGRFSDPHSLYVNFAHRFVFDPAFSGAARGGALAGLDGFALASFGFRYAVTNRLSVSAYRSPTFIGRPIQLMAAYNLVTESGGAPFNAAVRFSVEGQDNFRKNFTQNLEAIVSRSISERAQVYFVPTVSFNNRRLFQPTSYRSRAIPDFPGYNTFSTGVGAAVDVRPTIALLVEVIPTLVNGRPLAIHRPAYAFGIQKKILRHSFTIGFTNSPGTTVSQRAGTRAAYLNDPTADKPSGLFFAFDLMRQLR